MNKATAAIKIKEDRFLPVSHKYARKKTIRPRNAPLEAASTMTHVLSSTEKIPNIFKEYFFYSQKTKLKAMLAITKEPRIAGLNNVDMGLGK